MTAAAASYNLGHLDPLRVKEVWRQCVRELKPRLGGCDGSDGVAGSPGGASPKLATALLSLKPAQWGKEDAEILSPKRTRGRTRRTSPPPRPARGQADESFRALIS